MLWEINTRAKSVLLSITLIIFALHFGLYLLSVLVECQELDSLVSEYSLPKGIAALSIASFSNYFISAQFLIGLLWLMFHTHLIRRAGIVLRRYAYSFCPELACEPVYGAHGCRAPPLV